jgi:hypothetical protein
VLEITLPLLRWGTAVYQIEDTLVLINLVCSSPPTDLWFSSYCIFCVKQEEKSMLKFWHKVSYGHGTKNYTHELTRKYSLIEQAGRRVLSKETKKPLASHQDPISP